ncbi:MAG: RNA 2',3'-cyclic phosphodiesterase [Candidatus Terrybacteria bacterium]|nr:RNA 2',3'-cyclic phosphodiesterase [Candidatus Terrybacteria bacterium]
MKHRIFVAIDIPEELKNAAEAHIGEFYKNKLVRVVERENWHITVAFCGYLDDEKLNKLKEIARKITKETKSFELIPDKIIFAPPKRTPRMVWLTFKNSPEFSKISKLFSKFNQEAREPLLHLTLARFEEKHYSNLKPLLPQDGIDLKNETKSFMVKSINIMESHLSPKGPKYELLCQNYLR